MLPQMACRAATRSGTITGMTPKQTDQAIAELVTSFAANQQARGFAQMRLQSVGRQLQELGKALVDTPRAVCLKDGVIAKNYADAGATVEDVTWDGHSLRDMIEAYHEALTEQDRLSATARTCGLDNVLRIDP